MMDFLKQELNYQPSEALPAICATIPSETQIHVNVMNAELTSVCIALAIEVHYCLTTIKCNSTGRQIL